AVHRLPKSEPPLRRARRDWFAEGGFACFAFSTALTSSAGSRLRRRSRAAGPGDRNDIRDRGRTSQVCDDVLRLRIAGLSTFDFFHPLRSAGRPLIACRIASCWRLVFDSPLRRPGISTSAAPGLRSSTGSSRGGTAASSSCESKTPTPSDRPRKWWKAYSTV